MPTTNSTAPHLIPLSPALVLPSPWRDARVTVVMPTYNEAENLPGIVAEVLDLPLPNLSLKVVDDNSPDGTGDIAEQLAERANARGSRRMTVLHRTAKDGLGRAYAAGMSAALNEGAQFVLQMDADGSHPPRYIPQMLGTALSTSAGFVVGSRYASGGGVAQEWGWHRRLLSGWANFYVNSLLHLRVRDVTAGYVLWRDQTLAEIDLSSVSSAGYSFQVELKHRAVRAGHAVMEVPIHFEERQLGQSKMTLGVQIESALLPLRLRFRAQRVDPGARR